MTWLGVTPWSVLPDALPPWQTLDRLPKLDTGDVTAPGEDAEDEADGAEVDAGGLLLDPARLQPAATRAVTAIAANVLTETLTGFLLDECSPADSLSRK